VTDPRRVAIINGQPTEAPAGAVAWKYNDPTEDARWITDEAEARAIEREDASLIVWVTAPTAEAEA
jgi:hypothetical protein